VKQLKIGFSMILLMFVGWCAVVAMAQSATPNLKIRVLSADDRLRFYLNDVSVGQHQYQESQKIIELNQYLRQGSNQFRFTLEDFGTEASSSFELLANNVVIYRNDCYALSSANNLCAPFYRRNQIVSDYTIEIQNDLKGIRVVDKDADALILLINRSQWSGKNWYNFQSNFGSGTLSGNIDIRLNIGRVNERAAVVNANYSGQSCSAYWTRLSNQGEALVFLETVESGNCTNKSIVRIRTNRDGTIRYEAVSPRDASGNEVFSSFGLLTRQGAAPTIVTETPKDQVLQPNESWLQSNITLTLKDVRFSTQRGGSVAFALELQNTKESPIIVRYNLTDIVSALDNNNKAYKVLFGPSTKCTTFTETIPPNGTARLRCLASSEGAIFVDVADNKIKELAVAVSELSAIQNARWLIKMPR
jgi:hypothetical protein